MQPPPPSSALVVRADNAPARRLFFVALAVHALVTAALFAAIVLIGTLDDQSTRLFVLVFLILLAGQIFQIGYLCYVFGSRTAITEPLTISDWGVVINGQQGTVRLPWEAVTAVRSTRSGFQPAIAIVVHPRSRPGQHGVEGNPRHWRRYAKQGVLISGLGLDPGPTEILGAVHAHSRGRVPTT